MNVEEPKQFCEDLDNKASLATYRSWADQAWAEVGGGCPTGCLEGDYAWGFREGFAEFVYAGGSGEPPAVPPRPYWQVDLRSAEGAAAVKSWFEGYRHGARVAREGGYRQCSTIKLSASLRDQDACDLSNATQPSQPAAPLLEPTVQPGRVGPEFDAPELVPAPRELEMPPALSAPDSLLLNERLPQLPVGAEPPTAGADVSSLPVGSYVPVSAPAASSGSVRTALFKIVR